MSAIQPGVYLHKKGNKYRVLFTATDANNLSDNKGCPQVVYMSLVDGKMYVRDMAEFNEEGRFVFQHE